MKQLHPHTLGLALGIFAAVVHLCWAIMVWLGVGQYFLDFVFKLHMITPAYKVADFDFSTAIALVVLTGVIGYTFGVIIAAIWNHCKK